jgi:hypothetical protein
MRGDYLGWFVKCWDFWVGVGLGEEMALVSPLLSISNSLLSISNSLPGISKELLSPLLSISNSCFLSVVM